MAHILVVDDEPKMTSLICGSLEDLGHQVTTTTKPVEALELIDKHSFDIVITDLSMPKVDGMQVLAKALQKGGSEIIMMTAHGSVETAVEAMKQGAVEYLTKPFSLDELELVVENIVKNQVKDSLSHHYKTVAEQGRYGEFVGSAKATSAVKAMIEKVAATDATVMITGCSGTGKELAAHMVHSLSLRRDDPFIAINCAALTETLLESELFGHEKGAFTGAEARKRGRFELADKGTIFLDEIGEMSPGMQSKLLRVLEEHSLIRVGGVDTIDVDVRVIAATNRNLKEEIKTGRFREDLYFRLNVFPIRMPDVSERREDIPLLTAHILKGLNYRHSELSAEVIDFLVDYDWPGNVRELRNALERAMILAGDEPLSVEDFNLENESTAIDDTVGSAVGLESTEKQMILDALQKADGNKSEAARMLKITRRRLYSRMKAHGITI